MEKLLDPTNQAETEPPEVAQPAAIPEKMEAEATNQPPTEESETSIAPQSIEEIDTAPKAQLAKALPGKPAAYKREEPPPNPLLLDPYEWDRCTITVGYSLLSDKKVSVSVHNHKDEPIVREFPLEEVPLPEKISGVMAALQSIWPTSPVNAAVVLLPIPGERCRSAPSLHRSVCPQTLPSYRKVLNPIFPSLPRSLPCSRNLRR